MDIINLLCSAWPEGNFWANVIKLFDVGNYAWTIILFTLILKLVLTPLDFFQRYYTTKTSRAQAKLRPQLEKLQRQYGQNANLLAQKQNELYQKSGYSMKGSCIVMLVYMVVTLVVFISLYSSIQYIAGFKIKDQFRQLSETYSISYETDYYNYLHVDREYLNSLSTQEEKDSYINSKYEEKKGEINTQLGGHATQIEIMQKIDDDCQEFTSSAQDKVVEKYKEVKNSWLWIKNIWIADSATSKEILTYNAYKGATGDNISQSEYETVMAKLLDGDSSVNGVNGYFILSIIVVLVSFLSQYLSRKLTMSKDASPQSQGMGTKVMMFIMPFIMLMFTLNSSAIFSIYIIANSLISTLLLPITTILCNKIFDKQDKKVFEKTKVDYRRY